MIYVGNLVDVIESCMFHPTAAGKTYLVSDGQDVSTPEMMKYIAQALGRTSMLLPVPVLFLKLLGKITGKNEAMNRLLGSLTLDIQDLQRDLDWSPPFTMKQGIAKSIEWYMESKIREN
jgi:nucleoside-diphosphate-sugar epimerase